MTRAVLLSAAALGAASVLAACDAAPGLPDEVRRPSVTAFALTPDRDSLGTDAATATVPLVLDATVVGEGEVVVRALVRYAETDTLVAETRVEAQPGPVRIELPLVLPRGATGDYAVTLTTEGSDGRTGDGATALFRFRASSLGPPVVTAVEAAASVTRPTGNRAAPFPIVAVVADPDGLANVAAVLLTDPSGAVLGQLFDEGRDGRTDDAEADDGRYSASLQIPRDAEVGVYEFAVVAVDRAGRQSAPAPFTFEVR
ncbi:MAG TPA: hypothetical protein VF576_04065 [Rubricoccaceae bacterium]|jgi:hypothetical protein